MSNYQAIKNHCARACRLVDAGKLAEADSAIVDALAIGLTRADIAANIPRATLATLKKWRDALHADEDAANEETDAANAKRAERWNHSHNQRAQDDADDAADERAEKEHLRRADE